MIHHHNKSFLYVNNRPREGYSIENSIVLSKRLEKRIEYRE